MVRLILLLAALTVLATANPASAADPIVQNRDEVGRHPYAAAVGEPSCIKSVTCNLNFPAVEANKRAVIETISCSIRTTGFDGVNVSLSAASTPLIKAYFSPTPQQSGQNPVDSQTLVFVNGGDAPLVTIAANANEAFTGAPYCYIAGYTVTLS